MVKTEEKIPELRFPEFEGEWKNSKLSETAVITTGSTPPTSVNEYYNGEFLFVTPADLNKGRYVQNTKTTLTEKGFKKGRRISEGSTLFVSIGSTIGKVGQVVNECITNQQINALEAKSNYNNDFIFGVLSANGQKIKLLAGVQAVPQLNKTDFSNLRFYFPSLPEQQKIATFLTAVDDKIQQLTKKKALLEQYKKGVMQKIFKQQIRFKDDNEKEFPNWEERKLREIAEKINLKNTSNKINFVLTNSAKKGVVSQQDYFEKDIANQNNLSGYYIVNIDDFVYNPRISASAPVGPIKRNHLKRGVMSPLYTIFRFNTGDIRYFEFFFETTVWHKYMNSVANFGARFDRMNITNSDFLMMPLPYPCLKEQQKIANFLTAIDNKIEQVNTQLEKTKEFKKGLLQQMFV